MNLVYHNPGVDYMIDSILMFQSDNITEFWSDSLYSFYPQIDKKKAKQLNFEDRKKYIEKIIREIYGNLENELNQKIEVYNKYWHENKNQIEEALSEAFEIDCSALFNEMKCNISLNPVSPRFLKENSFEVFYLNSEKGALGISIHEIIHFIWFYVWNSLFDDDYDEYEQPSLKWILSEMVVESIMRDSRLSSINPYFSREHGGCIYPYFFDMKVDNKLVLNSLDEMYRKYNIKDFMKYSYQFCLQNDETIREHIAKSERIKGE